MTVIVPRVGWGFDGWRGGVAPNYVDPRNRTQFWLHYEGGGTCAHQVGPGVPLAIHHYHRDGNGWAGIGYGHVVDNAGTAFEGRGFAMVGAHCAGYNTVGFSVQVHICGAEEPSDAALRTVRALYEDACVHSGRSSLLMRGHRDGTPTACPGEFLSEWVKGGMVPPGGGGGTVPGPSGKVYLSKLHSGQIDSDSVKAAQEAFNGTSYPPHVNVPVTGNWLEQTDATAIAWQRHIGDTADPPGHVSIGPKQAARLFAPWASQVEIVNDLAQPPPPPPPPGGITTPFPGARVGTPFGKRGSWAAGYHTGRDYPCPIGTPLRSTWTSTVVGINTWGRAYGNHVIMAHGDSRIAYCHMDRVTVGIGQHLIPGSHVGYSGNTGNSTGPHVHVEERLAPFAYANRVRDPVL